jgi:hypothetical protein
LFFIRVRLFPELPGIAKCVNLESLPPCNFIVCLMELPVMASAKRDGKLVADFDA